MMYHHVTRPGTGNQQLIFGHFFYVCGGEESYAPRCWFWSLFWWFWLLLIVDLISPTCFLIMILPTKLWTAIFTISLYKTHQILNQSNKGGYLNFFVPLYIGREIQLDIDVYFSDSIKPPAWNWRTDSWHKSRCDLIHHLEDDFGDLLYTFHCMTDSEIDCFSARYPWTKPSIR